MLYTLEILLLSLLMICGLCAYGLALPFFLEKKKETDNQVFYNSYNIWCSFNLWLCLIIVILRLRLKFATKWCTARPYLKKKKKPWKNTKFWGAFQIQAQKNVLQTTKNLKNALKRFFPAFYHQNGSNEGVTR